MTDMTVTFQGTSAAVPTVKRGLSAVTVQRGGDLILFDCGEGTQRQMMKHTGLKAPRAIFITHAHGDHWTGLGGLLATLEMQEHTAHLPIYVHGSLLNKMQGSLQAGGGIPNFAAFHYFEPTLPVRFNPGTLDEFTVRAFETNHSRGSQGYVLEEPERPGRFDPNIALLSGVEPGPDFKRLQAGETVKGLRPEDVIGPPRRGRKVVYTGDTTPTNLTAQAAEGADLLIHEATFSETELARANKTRHSTGAGAGEVAACTLGLRRLALTHFSPRVNAREVVEQAAKYFSPVVQAVDGMQISIPLEA